METPLQLPPEAAAKNPSVFPVCGKLPNFFQKALFFDRIHGGKPMWVVENPVEIVDNRSFSGQRTGVILGDYVDRNLSVVVTGKKCRNVNLP